MDSVMLGSKMMALTRAFRVTVHRRAREDREFRKALLVEAVEVHLSGDAATGRIVFDVFRARSGSKRWPQRAENRRGVWD